MVSPVNSTKYLREEILSILPISPRRQREHFFILQGHYYPNAKTRWHYKNIKLQTSSSHLYTCKNPYQNISKSNPKITIHYNQMGCIPRVQGWFHIKKKKPINVIHHMSLEHLIEPGSKKVLEKQNKTKQSQ